MDITAKLSEELNLNPVYVENVINLIDEGNTIPFIARYRKEPETLQGRKGIQGLAHRHEGQPRP